MVVRNSNSFLCFYVKKFFYITLISKHSNFLSLKILFAPTLPFLRIYLFKSLIGAYFYLQHISSPNHFLNHLIHPKIPQIHGMQSKLKMPKIKHVANPIHKGKRAQPSGQNRPPPPPPPSSLPFLLPFAF